MWALVVVACGAAEPPIPTFAPPMLPALDVVQAAPPATTTTTALAEPTTTTTTTTSSQYPMIELLDATPYTGTGCVDSQLMLASFGGIDQFVWVMDAETLAVYSVDVKLEPTDELVQVLGPATALVGGRDGLVLVEDSRRTVLVAPPETERRKLLSSSGCARRPLCRGVLTVAVAGRWDDWIPVWWSFVTVTTDGLADTFDFAPGIDADGAVFSPNGTYLLAGAFGPDPAFGGLYRVIDVPNRQVLPVDEALLEPAEDHLLVSVGWVTDEDYMSSRGLKRENRPPSCDPSRSLGRCDRAAVSRCHLRVGMLRLGGRRVRAGRGPA